MTVYFWVDFNSVLPLKFLNTKMNNFLVEITTTNIWITICRAYFYRCSNYIQNRNIESTTAKIEENNTVLIIIIHKLLLVTKASSIWFIDQAQALKPSDFRSVISCLLLCDGEISWDGNNCFFNFSIYSTFS